MNPNLIIIPSRNRPMNIKRCVESIQATANYSDIVVAIDGDDAMEYTPIEFVTYHRWKDRGYAVGTINKTAMMYADRYETITFLGDDIVALTKSFDALLAEPLKLNGYGISYGNDGIHGEELPTHVMMTTNIIRALGFMGLPTLKHLFVDNFWMEIGQAMEMLFYVPEVVWEHRHFVNHKAPMDELYQFAYSDQRYAEDGKAFRHWQQTLKEFDCKQIQKMVDNEIR